MFECDLSELPTADLLESAAAHRAEANRLDAQLLEHAQTYADRFHPDVCPVRPGRRSCDGRERAIVLGGDGCPEIAEFAIAEFAAVLGVSPGVGARLLGDALALRRRFPFTWARILSGDATPWKARQLVAACVKLSQEAAAYVDRRVAAVIDTISPYRLEKIIKAAKFHVAPDLARAEADEKARERGVFVGETDEHGTRTMYIKASSGAVARNNATLNAIADALKIFGDPRALQHRRAEAVGIISDPLYTQELLTQASRHPNVTPTDPAPADLKPAPATTDAAANPHPAPNLAHAGSPGTPANAENAGDAGDEWNVRPRIDRRDEDLLDDWTRGHDDEPGSDDAVDCDAPDLSGGELPGPLDIRHAEALDLSDPLGPFGSGQPPATHQDVGTDDGQPLDDGALRELHTRLAQIKHDAYTNPTNTGQVRPGQTEIYVHLTDHTLATGTGVLRAETIGPLLASQLTELVGHGPYTVKPVIDLNDAVSVNAYEIPNRIRERVKLTHPVELFPFGTRETTRSVDLDHLRPYDPLGPPGQTSTTNLVPLGRFGHRVKTHARGWSVRRVDYRTVEWTTPHGFRFRVDPTGTHRVPDP
ncbi:DUF222 domain-containing protein [Kribbella sindirgiensis]|uniref:DUF222 domain-containing protein n=1 Tax=Kribbella sindirgiensis TaxID=1124744 RepID=A0A4R0IDI6_9ACTN|nr:DUF222 domain-containing protein [Kribbella sindirgiensis]TCC31233.1 DUF222 domain-containing protein [Kribbella sindirgiensis]